MSKPFIQKSKINKKDYSKYPFLKDSLIQLNLTEYTLNDIISNDNIVELTIKHINNSVKEIYIFDELEDCNIEVFSFILSKIILSSINDKKLIDLFCKYYYERIKYYLLMESPKTINNISKMYGFNYKSYRLCLYSYVELVYNNNEPKWKLINRDIINGNIVLAEEDVDDILAMYIIRDIKMSIKNNIKNELSEYLTDIIEKIEYKRKKYINSYSSYYNGNEYPPCIEAIKNAINNGTNVSQTARFLITAYLHTIGIENDDIIELFNNSPDFNYNKTKYQVDYITGKNGKEYMPQNCKTLKTYGLCVSSKCGKIVNPLQFKKGTNDEIKCS